MVKKIYILLIIGAILSACASSTPVPTVTQAPFQLKINSNKIISMAPIYIADAEGFFTEQNLQVEILTFNRSSESLPLLANGDLDVYNGGLESGVINTIASSENIMVVADKGHFVPGDCSYHAMLLRQDLYESGTITKPIDLKGKTIATTITGITGYMLTHYLEPAGLTLADLNFIEIPRASIVEAFKNESIDAAVVQDPYIAQILATGVASVWLKAEDLLPGFQNAIVVFGSRLIKERPDVGVRFMVAYLKGVKQYGEGKTDRNIEIITKYTEMLKEDIQTSCWPPIREDGQIDYSSIKDYLQWNIEAGYVDKQVSEDKFWNPYFVEQAYAIINP